MAAPSLRLYESHGLLEPDRTPGGTRRYSVDDLERLRTIAELLEDGVNLTGISMILRLREENDQLREENRRLTVSR
ncbi:MerR family transcriptional regulator [Ornithinimicrobium avium]|uniref:MerR family transcriptional regulator n=2 Tax=Ornithinimicrobium avium TaxID=2283195 RepID=A0A345NSL7_9MICO|nr:MerR family transcriptional regulator [Ornithinimicrobium avium]